MTKKVLLVAALAWASISVVIARGGEPVQAPAPAASEVTAHQETLDRYCITCHNERLNLPAGAPLHLDALDLSEPARDAAEWERVIRKLNVGAMPPQGMPRPEGRALDALVGYLSTELERAADAANNPGEFVMHRLNRAEYANAVRDLLGIHVDVTDLLPPDSSDFGFDNIATALQVTPALLERYLTAAMRISTAAIGDSEAQPAQARFPLRLDYTQNGYVEGLPFGTRGGALIRHNFPADGEYEFSAQLFRPIDNADTGIEGHDSPHEFLITIDGVPVHSATFGGPEDHAGSVQNMAATREDVEARMRVRLPVTAGPHEVGFTFVEKPTRSQDIFQVPIRASQDLHVGSGLPKLMEVVIGGPYGVVGVSDTPARERLFVCTPASAREETACARQILSTLARRAYRRPVTAADLQPLMEFYEIGRRDAGFAAGIRSALTRVLASPAFLFRTEQDRTDGLPHPVNDVELASRLSFFLWSSIPDDELLDLAIAGRLREPGVLEQQVRRMIADDRSDALMSNFASQWLALRNLEGATPDLLGFPEWDDNLRQALRQETELFFASIVREDRSVLDLLEADHTFVNERLARHYGIAGIYGPQFRRVTVTDPNRYGLLGHASILTLTSVATRTSPVFRGKYILSTFLNTPPLPPPPDVANVLPPEGESEAPKTVRARLEAHRSNAVCASCHRSMDPIGFALENFDPVGQWRTREANGTPVDSSGVLVDGTPVDGPIALREALASRPEVFVGTVTEKLLIYALGRGLEAYDMPLVRRIGREAADNDYRFMDIITGIVESRPFQMRKAVID